MTAREIETCRGNPRPFSASKRIFLQVTFAAYGLAAEERGPPGKIKSISNRAADGRSVIQFPPTPSVAASQRPHSVYRVGHLFGARATRDFTMFAVCSPLVCFLHYLVTKPPFLGGFVT